MSLSSAGTPLSAGRAPSSASRSPRRRASACAGAGRSSRWAQLGAGLCEFECLAPFLLFVSPGGLKFCYTSAEYAAHLLLLHSELRPVAPEPAPPMRAARPATLISSANATGANATGANTPSVDTTLADDIQDFPGGYIGAVVAGASVLVGLLAVCVLL